MISQEEALGKILAHVSALPPQVLPLARSVDRFAARDLFASLSLPPFDNSAMDGYAISSSAGRAGSRLRVIGEQPAGLDRGLTIRHGEAVRILTGAPIPAGADAVIMQEDIILEGDEIILQENVSAGEFVRHRGGDVAEGQKLIAAGDRITPQMAALLASQGLAEIDLGGAARVAIISTGDELASPGGDLKPGQIYESNSILLQTLLEKLGAEVVSISHCSDRAEEIDAAIRAGTTCDAMIFTGGVSVGARDLVKPALADAGATIDLWRVAVKPGKPFLFGHAQRCAIFGLPGNPVSAFVTFLLFVRPALSKMMGANESALELTRINARLAEAVTNVGDRPHYMRGMLVDGEFSPIGRQESHALYGLARSNALLLVTPGRRLDAGEAITALVWD